MVISMPQCFIIQYKMSIVGIDVWSTVHASKLIYIEIINLDGCTSIHMHM